ncbi:hypothetical protein [Deinococcus planocerae]|uniref:hypothetical protein n=1 Tax=Deinococcus planocerae TaxID=1737569 RepID=UPI0015E102E6|nr:hypothetical protein [Deinococcus planocerae]
MMKNVLFLIALLLALYGLFARSQGIYINPWLTWLMILAPVLVGAIQGLTKRRQD